MKLKRKEEKKEIPINMKQIGFFGTIIVSLVIGIMIKTSENNPMFLYGLILGWFFSILVLIEIEGCFKF